MSEVKERLKEGAALAKKAVFLEGGLTVLKLVIGFLSGSMVLLSDALHSASDMVAVLTSFFGLKIAGKKPSKRFTFGYFKAENIGTLIISFLIIWAGINLFSSGYGHLFSYSVIKIPFFALGISLLDALILFFFGRLEIKIGKKVGASSLIAMGEENRTHLVSSMAVFAGTLSSIYHFPYLEGLVTMGVSLLILKIGIFSLKDSLLTLMDIGPEEEYLGKVIKAIEKVAGVEEAFSLRLRSSGPFLQGEVKVAVRRKLSVDQAHRITDQIESKVQKAFPKIESLSVHLEPLLSDFIHLVLPVSGKKGLDSPLSLNFGKSPYLLFVNLEKDKVKGFYFLKNFHANKKVKAGLGTANLVVEQKSGVVLVSSMGEIAFNSLRANLVDVYQVKGKIALGAIAEYNQKKAKLLTFPTKKKS